VFADIAAVLPRVRRARRRRAGYEISVAQLIRECYSDTTEAQADVPFPELVENRPLSGAMLVACRLRRR
jgi:hypothetical protein